jgi:hypothetical protein
VQFYLGDCSVFEETAILRFGAQLNSSSFRSGKVPVRRASLYDGNLLSPDYEKVFATAPALRSAPPHVCTYTETYSYIHRDRLHNRTHFHIQGELKTCKSIKFSNCIFFTITVPTYTRGRVSKPVTNGSKTAVRYVLGFLCVSQGSSTVQRHHSLGSRRTCAC